MIKSRTWELLVLIALACSAYSCSAETGPDVDTFSPDVHATDTNTTDPAPSPPLLTHPIISLEGSIEESHKPNGQTTYALGDLACDVPCAYPFGAELFGSIANIGFEYRVKPQSSVRAAVDADVVFTKTNIPSSNDMEIHMKTSEDSPYVLIYDHVSAPTVGIGDKVVAGQVLGKAGHWDASHGTVELQINYEDPETFETWAVCPVELGSAEFISRHKLWLQVHNLSAPVSSHPGFQNHNDLCLVEKRFP